MVMFPESKRAALTSVVLALVFTVSPVHAAGDTNEPAPGARPVPVPWTGVPADAVEGAVPLGVAVPTIFLDVSGVQSTISVPSTVTYHPGFGFYYASGTGNTTRPGFVFGPGGGAPTHVEEPLNIDPRAWNFNSNTGLVEVVTFDAVSGGAGRGLIEAQTDGGGLLNGGTASLLPSMPGNLGSQTAPAYDAGANVFYSRDNSNVVNRVSRVDGSLVSSFNLDFASAGITAALNDGIVFVPELAALGVLDELADTLSLFDLAGAYLATVSLPVDLTSDSRRPGYANGQLFVWDDASTGWQGLRIVDAVQPPIQEIPTLSAIGLSALALVLAGLAAAALRRRRAA
jgi:hypothetical protein